ncbi:MAG: TetR/AcrR family transcriptional regulator [Nocardioidaceae bacterium]
MATRAIEREHASARAAAKFESRRADLARDAMAVLAQHGYANTSLRDIAQGSTYSHGVLHYYFADKSDLIAASVREYKARCVRRFDDLVVASVSPEEFVAEFLELLTDSLLTDGPMHRVWYDLRAQSLYDETLRPEAMRIDAALEDMVWRVVSRFAELRGTAPTCSPAMAYALVDGLFQRALLGSLTSDRLAVSQLRHEAEVALRMATGG